ncbi:MAG: sulfatase [Haloarculaceae archaeon]
MYEYSMNVLVFVSDALRPDHLSCYGHHRPTSPALDQLASDGVLFENAFSQAIWTVPSSGSILTSQYPLTHSCLSLDRKLSEHSPPLSVPLKNRGFETGLVTDMFQIQEKRGFGRGFDSYRYLPGQGRGRGIDSPETVADEAIDWLERNADEDFFLFVWTSATHTPYQTPREPEYADPSHHIDGSVRSLMGLDREHVEHVRDLYDDTITYADDQFGRVVDALRELEVYDDTHVVFTADHGEVFDEHARFEHARFDSLLKKLIPQNIQDDKQIFEPGSHVGHQALLPFDELVRVPLVMKFPEGEFAGERVDHSAQTIDIGPTIFDTMGAEVPETMQGESLLPTVRSDRAVNEYVCSTSSIIRSHVYYHSVRGDDHKYVKIDSDGLTLDKLRFNPPKVLQAQLFKSLHRDDLLLALPDETSDVIENGTKLTEEYRREFERWEKAVRSGGSLFPERQLDEDAKEQLRQLGYLN